MARRAPRVLQRLATSRKPSPEPSFASVMHRRRVLLQHMPDSRKHAHLAPQVHARIGCRGMGIEAALLWPAMGRSMLWRASPDVLTSPENPHVHGFGRARTRRSGAMRPVPVSTHASSCQAARKSPYPLTQAPENSPKVPESTHADRPKSLSGIIFFHLKGLKVFNGLNA